MANEEKHEYWRGLEELLRDPEFVEAQRGEFPVGADETPDQVSRRNFMKLMGAGAGLAGLVGCSQPPRDKILPHTVRPPEQTPGNPNEYATAFVLDGYARGVLARSTDGRPTKIEGNPDHPASLGATMVFEQASVLQLYDPDRSRGLRKNGYPASWTALLETITAHKADGGARLRFVLEPTSSLLLVELLEQLRTQYPRAKVVFHSSASRRNVWAATRAIYGRAADPIHDFSRANVIVDLDADFTSQGPAAVRYARDFAQKRKGNGLGGGNRLYVIEPAPTPTGSVADHRFRSRAGDVIDLVAALAPNFGVDAGIYARNAARANQQWVGAITNDLERNRGAGLLIAGDRQPPAVHLLVHAINVMLGNVGRKLPVGYIESPIYQAGEASHDIVPLVQEMKGGAVDCLVILDGNPSYSTPAELGFGDALAKIPNSIYLGLFENETSRSCHWYVGGTHYLETWGDARSFDGTPTLQQPLIAPLYDGRSPVELIASVLGRTDTPHQLMVASWRARAAQPDFQIWWDKTIQRGFVENSASPLISGPGQPNAQAGEPPRPAPEWEILTPPSAAMYDGRFANISWMLEFPDPMTKLTWDNAALISPASAKKLGVGNGDMLEVKAAGRSLAIATLVLPGHADGSVTITQGWGRQGLAEELCKGVGWNASVVRSVASPDIGGGELKKTGGEHKLALTQVHWSMEGRPIGLTATKAEFEKNQDIAASRRGPVPSLFKLYDYSKGDQWGMAIDLTTCTGCSACVIACQSENNIPVVGKEQVLKSREMQWIRIDRYFMGDDENDPGIVNQPMMCQHCETAPCEYVCPVNATVHSPDGLNEMVYNRCIGTRFCQNNCPYKVRRFNFFDFVARDSRQLAMNPDVTVRERGVMEKCTFCVQRIRKAEIGANIEGRHIQADEFTSACAQACPTKAIVFGNINDPKSEVFRLRQNPRGYEVLNEQGTRPRVRYMVKITDPTEIG